RRIDSGRARLISGRARLPSRLRRRPPTECRQRGCFADRYRATRDASAPGSGGTATKGDPVIQVRRSEDRGHADHGWLDTRHTFSFADYDDPRYRGFRDLRVINEDHVAPGAGFPTHGHRDMEILTYVLSGAVEHRDSLGSRAVVRPGEVQRMTAGRGVMHSELNPSRDEPLHLLQIWILPEGAGLEPGYEQRAFPIDAERGRLTLVASHDGRDGSLTIHQDASVYAGALGAGDRVEVSGHALAAGDGLAASEEKELAIAAGGDAEVLLFDLA